MSRDKVQFSDLIGKTLVSVTGSVGDERMTFTVSDNESYILYHVQDCCETVKIEDICGDINDLIGSPITQAEESTNDTDWPDDTTEDATYVESFTWTFYRIATMKGQIVVRWLGESNGYYSESVDFAREL